MTISTSQSTAKKKTGSATKRTRNLPRENEQRRARRAAEKERKELQQKKHNEVARKSYRKRRRELLMTPPPYTSSTPRVPSSNNTMVAGASGVSPAVGVQTPVGLLHGVQSPRAGLVASPHVPMTPGQQVAFEMISNNKEVQLKAIEKLSEIGKGLGELGTGILGIAESTMGETSAENVRKMVLAVDGVHNNGALDSRDASLPDGGAALRSPFLQSAAGLSTTRPADTPSNPTHQGNPVDGFGGFSTTQGFVGVGSQPEFAGQGFASMPNTPVPTSRGTNGNFPGGFAIGTTSPETTQKAAAKRRRVQLSARHDGDVDMDDMDTKPAAI